MTNMDIYACNGHTAFYGAKDVTRQRARRLRLISLRVHDEAEHIF